MTCTEVEDHSFGPASIVGLVVSPEDARILFSATMAVVFYLGSL
jgi:hypothetical protein